MGRINAIAWLNGRPYEAHTTSGNPTDLFLLVPLAAVHALGPPSFWLLRASRQRSTCSRCPIGFWFVRRIYGSTTAWIYTAALAVAPTASHTAASARIRRSRSSGSAWSSTWLLALVERARAIAWLGLRSAALPSRALDTSDQMSSSRRS